jgi:hypothetical protein
VAPDEQTGQRIYEAADEYGRQLFEKIMGNEGFRSAVLSSAVVAQTEFGNIAQAIVRQGIPYALGMQFVLLDDAALEVSNTLYRHLLRTYDRGSGAPDQTCPGAECDAASSPLACRDSCALYTSARVCTSQQAENQRVWPWRTECRDIH